MTSHATNRGGFRVARASRVAIGAAVLAVTTFGSAGSAAAVDRCIDFPFQTIVARNLRIPKADKCTAVLGHAAGFSGPSPTLAGSACTNTDGTRVDFSLTEHDVGSDSSLERTDYLIRIDLPGLTGTAFRQSAGFATQTFPVSIVPCADSDLSME